MKDINKKSKKLLTILLCFITLLGCLAVTGCSDDDGVKTEVHTLESNVTAMNLDIPGTDNTDSGVISKITSFFTDAIENIQSIFSDTSSNVKEYVLYGAIVIGVLILIFVFFKVFCKFKNSAKKTKMRSDIESAQINAQRAAAMQQINQQAMMQQQVMPQQQVVPPAARFY